MTKDLIENWDENEVLNCSDEEVEFGPFKRSDGGYSLISVIREGNILYCMVTELDRYGYVYVYDIEKLPEYIEAAEEAWRGNKGIMEEAYKYDEMMKHMDKMYFHLTKCNLELGVAASYGDKNRGYNTMLWEVKKDLKQFMKDMDEVRDELKNE